MSLRRGSSSWRCTRGRCLQLTFHDATMASTAARRPSAARHAASGPDGSTADGQRISRARMRQRQRKGVQRQPVQAEALPEQPVVLALAVVHVADDRAGDVLQVPADLMKPAGAGNGLDQRVALPRPQRANVGHGQRRARCPRPRPSATGDRCARSRAGGRAPAPGNACRPDRRRTPAPAPPPTSASSANASAPLAPRSRRCSGHSLRPSCRRRATSTPPSSSAQPRWTTTPEGLSTITSWSSAYRMGMIGVASGMAPAAVTRGPAASGPRSSPR